MSPHSTPEQAAVAEYIFEMLDELALMAERDANEPEMAILIRALVTCRRTYVRRFDGLVENLSPQPSLQGLAH